MAHFTLKFLLLGVFPKMSLHVVLEFESLVADRAFVLVGCIVLVHMVFQEMRAFESLATDMTGVVVVVGK